MRCSTLRRVGVALSTALLGPVVTLPAEAPAGKPIGMGDLFLVEQNGGWFCPTSAASVNVKCPDGRDSATAAKQLMDTLTLTPA